MASEEARLMDRLIGVRAAESGWPVCGEHEQRRLGLTRFHDRRKQVRHGRPRRRHHGGWAPGGLSYAEREEAGGALVEVDPEANARITSQGQHQGGGP